MQRKWAVGSGAALGFAAALGMIVASALITVLNIRWIVRNEDSIVQTQEVLHTLDDVLLKLTELETSQRAYLLTGQMRFRKEFEERSVRFEEHLDEMTGLFSGKLELDDFIPELRERTLLRLRTIREGITVRDREGFEGGSEFVAYGQGKEQMDDVRAVVADMKRVENELLKSGERESRQSYWIAIASTVLASLIGLGMVVTAYVLTAREMQARARTAEHLEARVQERTNELNQANLALLASNRDLEQFASVASHDLQEPLRKIEAFGDRLKVHHRETLSDQGRDYLDRILSSATRMRTLINDLLNFSRVSTRALPFTRVDLTKVAQEVVLDLEERLRSARGSVEVGPLPEIDADPTQMRQLFQNLIGNALKFQRPETAAVVKIRAEEPSEESGEPHCRITVADNGIGFEETYVDRIFQVFQRLHGRNEYEGTGIGLAICRKVVERHRGSITAHSTPGSGSTFTITLPYRQNGKDTV